jgi:hypothetical protein
MIRSGPSAPPARPSPIPLFPRSLFPLAYQSVLFRNAQLTPLGLMPRLRGTGSTVARRYRRETQSHKQRRNARLANPFFALRRLCVCSCSALVRSLRKLCVLSVAYGLSLLNFQSGWGRRDPGTVELAWLTAKQVVGQFQQNVRQTSVCRSTITS